MNSLQRLNAALYRGVELLLQMSLPTKVAVRILAAVAVANGGALVILGTVTGGSLGNTENFVAVYPRLEWPAALFLAGFLSAGFGSLIFGSVRRYRYTRNGAANGALVFTTLMFAFAATLSGNRMGRAAWVIACAHHELGAVMTDDFRRGCRIATKPNR